MKLNVAKVSFFFGFLLIVFYFFKTEFEEVYIAFFAVFLFVFSYLLVLYCVKHWHSRIFNKVFFEYAEVVDSDRLLDVEPHVRGMLIFRNLKLFSRISANEEGIFVYKQGGYSFCFPWDAISLCERVSDNSIAALVTIKRNSECNFLIPWSRTLRSSAGF